MKQLTVLLDNVVGTLARLSEVLAQRNVNIETIDSGAASAQGIVWLTVDKYDVALVALRDAGFQAVTEDALLIRLKDEPGALAKAAARFKHAGLNIRSLRILKREADYSLVTLVTDDNDTARKLVEDVLLTQTVTPN